MCSRSGETVTFDEMCRELIPQRLSRRQLLEHWDNLKTPEQYAESQRAFAEEFRQAQPEDVENAETLQEDSGAPCPGDTPMTEEEIQSVQNIVARDTTSSSSEHYGSESHTFEFHGYGLESHRVIQSFGSAHRAYRGHKFEPLVGKWLSKAEAWGRVKVTIPGITNA